jgi:hypothetical protein
MIGTIHSIDEMPDLDEMIEAKNADTREDQIEGIVERIFEDWDCRVPRDEVRMSRTRLIPTGVEKNGDDQIGKAV